MTEEIKEILERAKNLKNKCSCCEQIGENVYVSRYHEIQTQNLAEAVYLIDKLLDYITNLQQENKELNRMCELYSKSLYNAELTDYKSRCEKANKLLNKLDFDNFVYGKTALKDIKKNLQNILNGSDEK